jgi:hypothetical protein
MQFPRIHSVLEKQSFEHIVENQLFGNAQEIWTEINIDTFNDFLETKPAVSQISHQKYNFKVFSRRETNHNID